MKFTLVIDSGNAALVDNPDGELSRILTTLAKKITCGESTSGVLKDVNGATVGEWDLELEISIPTSADVIDSIEIDRDGRLYRVELVPDHDSDPSEAECYSSDDINGWRRDAWRYVGVVVTDMTSGRNASLWGVEYGHLADVWITLNSIINDVEMTTTDPDGIVTESTKVSALIAELTEGRN